VTTDEESVEARFVTLERQTDWLAVELDRVTKVLLSMAAVTNEELLGED
jgi:chaperonin cofactor prefoldin